MPPHDDAASVQGDAVAIGYQSVNGDVEMEETSENVQDVRENESTIGRVDISVETEDDKPINKSTFLDFLTSPVVTLLIGKDQQTILRAHQALLSQSPYLDGICQTFVSDGSVRIFSKILMMSALSF